MKAQSDQYIDSKSRETSSNQFKNANHIFFPR